jgi:hypothetical protein
VLGGEQKRIEDEDEDDDEDDRRGFGRTRHEQGPHSHLTLDSPAPWR